jgi:hypothetical protein
MDQNRGAFEQLDENPCLLKKAGRVFKWNRADFAGNMITVRNNEKIRKKGTSVSTEN